MTAPNRNTLWGRTILSELAVAGIEQVCIAPGSRSTPLTEAAFATDDVTVYTHLDERSMAYFALGQARRTGDPTPIICTSGTAAANFHPAVIEANQARVPMVVLTADRPPELRNSGANQTIDQQKLYGDAVRLFQQLPKPASSPRMLRSLRTTVTQAISAALNPPSGPVHLNVPFEKPLEPTDIPEDIPDTLQEQAPEAVQGRNDSFVNLTTAATVPESVDQLVSKIEDSSRPLIVAGPTDPRSEAGKEVVELAATIDAPIFADPLSNLRFSSYNNRNDILICSGYDAYISTDQINTIPAPDLVLRIGASPTSKSLRKYLAAIDTQQILVDPAGQWREAEFTATDLVTGNAGETIKRITASVTPASDNELTTWLRQAEQTHWQLINEIDVELEGLAIKTVLDTLPEKATLVVSNSMPVRDLDRFGQAKADEITAIGNRGASGIDGITSTAFGAASATSDPTVLVIGDLAFYHDMNGLLAAGRHDIDLTIVLINNNGGGIFHKLPIESFDPPFTEGFKTPHQLNFRSAGDLYGIQYQYVNTVSELAKACKHSINTSGTDIIEIQFDSEISHRNREQLQQQLQSKLSQR